MNASAAEVPVSSLASCGRRPRPALLAAVLVFFSVGYFQNSRPGWNVNSQFALAVALAERGTLRIDAYHEHPALATGDKAFFDGHYYSDKSPVTAFLAAPACWAYFKITRAFGLPVDYARARHWATWWAIGLSAGCFVYLLAIGLARRGIPEATAAQGAALWWIATPLAGYSILFSNYLPACALALGGWLLAESCWRAPARVTFGRILFAGILLGLAAWTLNTLALVALALTIVLFISSRHRPLLPIAWVLGGVIGMSGYFIYNYSIFRSFSSAYAYEVDPFFREQMARGLMGATMPRPIVAWLITFHPYQGLLLWFPVVSLACVAAVLLLAAAGPGRSARRPAGARIDGLLAVLVFFALLLYTSAYFMWWGGWAYAPRHLIPALVGLGLCLHPLLRSPPLRRIYFVVGVIGAIVNVSAIALDPQAPPPYSQELMLQPESVTSGWPSPMLMLLRYVWLAGQVDGNWGVKLGLSGLLSLVPLAVAWLVFWLYVGVLGRNDGTGTPVA